MNEHVQFAYLVLWVVQPVLEALLVMVMWRRQLHKVFPAFYTNLLWMILEFSVLFPIFMMGSYEWYYYCFWTGLAINVILGFRVIHEIFLDVFRPYHTLKDLGTVIFKWAGLVMLLVSAVVAFSSAAPEQSPLSHAVLTLHRSVRLTQCGLILFLLVFSKYLGISWRQKSFGLALGFGSFATTEMAVTVLNVGGYLNSTDMNVINLIAFNLSVLIWMGYMMAKSPERLSSANLLQSQRWDRSLSSIQHPMPADSLIPMFEGMVERAFSRSNGQSAVEDQSTTMPELVLRSDSFRVENSGMLAELPGSKR